MRKGVAGAGDARRGAAAVRGTAARSAIRVALVAVLATAAMLAIAPAALAAFHPVASQPPNGFEQLAVADAQRWIASREVPAAGADLTVDGGASWTPLPVADSLVGIAAAPDGSFRMVTERWSGSDRALRVQRIDGAGAVTEIAGSILTSPGFRTMEVDGSGSTWILQPGPNPALWLIGPTGGVINVPVPSAPAYTMDHTVFGLRLLAGNPAAPLRLEGQQLVAAEPHMIEYAASDLWLGSGGASWDAGRHWAGDGIGAQVVARARAIGGTPRYLMTFGSSFDSGRLIQRHSSWLFWATDVRRPLIDNLPAVVVDAGDGLVAWRAGTILVHHGPLPAPPARIGPVPADAQRMIDRANVFRADAGIPPLTGDSRISQAASNHSNYTRLNPGRTEGLSAHYETEGAPGFTGGSPSDRCAAVGADCGSEVMFGGGEDDPVGGWLATPFHRFVPGSPTQGVVGAGRVDGGWSVMNGGEQFGLLLDAFGYPNGRWRGDDGFAGEVPDPVQICNQNGNPISYPVGIAVTLYVPDLYSSLNRSPIESVEVRRRGVQAPLAGCLLGGIDEGRFVLDDPLVAGATYDAVGRWLAAPGLALVHRWSFTYQPEKPRPRAGDTRAPTLSPLSLSRWRFRTAEPRPRVRRASSRPRVKDAARKPTRKRRRTQVGTRIRFSASERGRLEFSVQRRARGRRAGGRRQRGRCVEPTRALVRRRAKRCSYWAWAGASVYRMPTAGAHSFRFLGRVRMGWLEPGRYRMRATAQDRAGNSSRARLARFTVVRR